MEEAYLELEDCFVARYDAGARDLLAPHRDGTLLSFSLLLSDEAAFEGGATAFPAYGAVPVATGSALLHSGQMLHGGAQTTRGTRVILVGFVAVDAAVVDRAVLAKASRDLGRLTQLRRVRRQLRKRGLPMIFKRATPQALLKASLAIDRSVATAALRRQRLGPESAIQEPTAPVS